MLCIIPKDPVRNPKLDSSLGLYKPLPHKQLFLIAGKYLIIFVISVPLLLAIKTKNLPIILITLAVLALTIASYVAIKWSMQDIQNRKTLGTTWKGVDYRAEQLAKKTTVAIHALFSAGPFHHSYK